MMASAPSAARCLNEYHGSYALERVAAFRRLSLSLERALGGALEKWDDHTIAAMLRVATEAMRETKRIIAPEWQPPGVEVSIPEARSQNAEIERLRAENAAQREQLERLHDVAGSEPGTDAAGFTHGRATGSAHERAEWTSADGR